MSHQAVSCRREHRDLRPLRLDVPWSRGEAVRLSAVVVAAEYGREAIGISGAEKGELKARAWELKASCSFESS